MKAYTVVLLLAAVAFVECGHTFLGSSVMRPLVHHVEARYPSKWFQKRIEFFNYTLPAIPGFARSIQGILAYDLTRSGASANVTAGGLGYNFVNLRMKSDRAKELRYDIYIHA
ncbi:hypothetical protein PYW08_002581 [Mythimna loreyi]|uniref:Uncharacterized protein n=1 Tax=Mythimna loreyi TaxID=667449 RepID=A0ACC2QIW4_9NEOP|nr:hypothetical protein PYW08_002581 [Mythimna loreyi]